MTVAGPRIVLFLQGPLSPLFARIGAELRQAGHRVHRIDLSVGDALHWRGGGAESYRGSLDDWQQHVGRRIGALGVTDLVLHNHLRPYHAAALAAAAPHRVTAHVTELGLLRGGSMTLVQGPAGALPQLPRDPAEIRRLARHLPRPDLAHRYPASFWRVAAPDVVYNLAQTLAWPLYPRYRRHTIYSPPVEYAAWIGRLLTQRRRDAAVGALARRLGQQYGSVFVHALQLDGDFQVRASAFGSQTPAIRTVIASFARHAPAPAQLVFKTHPLDNGLERWGRLIAQTATDAGVPDRVHLADGGSLPAWLACVEGLVTLNSTAGLEALQAAVPVATLAPAVYALDGLTHQGPLDTFWSAPPRPDAGLLDDLVAVIAATTQVPGSLYDARGLADAVAGIAGRIVAFAPSPRPVAAAA